MQRQQQIMAFWQQAIAVTHRILLELFRRRGYLVCWSLFPVFVLMLNGTILAEGTPLSSVEAFELAAPLTLIGAALFFSCFGGTLATVVCEREQRTLRRLFLSPLNGNSYFCGILLAHSVIGIGQAIAIYTIAAFLGARFNGSPLLGALIVLLSIIAYTGSGFILGTQFACRTEDVNELISTIGVPTLILGGAFLPTSFFPPLLLDLAQFNPVYHMGEALTNVSANGATLTEILPHLRFLTLFATLTLSGGWFSYRNMLRGERQI